MVDSPNLGLPLLAAAQAQKHVTHNDALMRLDGLVQLSAKSRVLATPPTVIPQGARWLVPASASGVWAGKTNQIALGQDGVFLFLTPLPGWFCWLEDEALYVLFDGTMWRSLPGTSDSLVLNYLALGTTIDTANPLSAKLNNALITAKSVAESGTGDLRMKLNKSATSNTVSQLYQNAYSGRAEVGLVGDDKFRVKVSADGTTWKDGLSIDPATGKASFPLGLLGDKPGFRNRLINGNFQINQRVVSGTVTLAAGVYGHDRWKAGAGGCTYTFSTSGTDTTLTITAGTLLQVIEGANIADTGSYTLSWTGTATARVYQGAASGSYAAAPITTGSLTAGSNTTVEFSTGTLTKAQLEPGSNATDFERRLFGAELQLCQRYYAKTFSYGVAPAQNAGFNGCLFLYAAITNSAFGTYWNFPVQMRAAPTCTAYCPNAASANWSAGGVACNFAAGINPSTDRVPVIALSPTISAGTFTSIHVAADAEL